jgi:hypothetical protein
MTEYLLDEHGRPYHPDMELSWQTYLGNNGQQQPPEVRRAYIAAWYAGSATKHTGVAEGYSQAYANQMRNALVTLLQSPSIPPVERRIIHTALLSNAGPQCQYPMSYGKLCDLYPNCECGKSKAQGIMQPPKHFDPKVSGWICDVCKGWNPLGQLQCQHPHNKKEIEEQPPRPCGDGCPGCDYCRRPTDAPAENKPTMGPIIARCACSATGDKAECPIHFYT